MVIYIDISEFFHTRITTGIQRVIREFIQKAMDDNYNLNVIYFDLDSSKYRLLPLTEVKKFLGDVKNYKLKNSQEIDLFEDSSSSKALFEIDSVWNTPLKRVILYKQLKEHNFKIFNFIHDFISVANPDLLHDNTRRNFVSYLSAVYEYSDLIFFNSISTQDDFYTLKKQLNCDRDIPTKVTHLGSNFVVKKSKSKYSKLLKKKYILFVGTIEPRKKQPQVLEVFEKLHEEYPELHLVLIGKIGWKREDFLEKLENHNLKDKNIHHLTGIDDNDLNLFYQNTFIVTYLSEYEGYGLPIAESLQHSNITITSKNSSMYEVGRNFADYILYDSQSELHDIISLYLDNKTLYETKKQFIKDNFTTPSWIDVYNSFKIVFDNFDTSTTLLQNHQRKLQFVFISIDYENLEGTMALYDKYASFIKEYIIVTRGDMITQFGGLKSNHKITLVDEKEILQEYAEDFSKRDHQSKNWLLRASLLNLEYLDDEFIMLDDDNRPLTDVNLDYYISQDGRYSAYYFHNLLEWNQTGMDYDVGQKNMAKLLHSRGLETLSYSAHKPQIINRKIFAEAVDEFFEIGLEMPIDEWSIYFNFAVAKYPALFNKKIFQTLNWPSNPSDWDTYYQPENYKFENFYQGLYDEEIFSKDDSFERKIAVKQTQLDPFIATQKLNENYKKFLKKSDEVYGVLRFESENFEIYLSNIPKTFQMVEDSFIKLRINYKLLNKKSSDEKISIGYMLDDDLYLDWLAIPNSGKKYLEDVVEFPISALALRSGENRVNFIIKDGEDILKLENKDLNIKVLKLNEVDKEIKNINNPPAPKQDLEPQTATYSKPLFQEITPIDDEEEMSGGKKFLKSIPMVGWLMRWSFNLLKLNNIKHTLFMRGKEIDVLGKRVDELTDVILMQQKQIQTYKNEFNLRLNNQNNQIENTKENLNKRVNNQHNQIVIAKNELQNQDKRMNNQHNQIVIAKDELQNQINNNYNKNVVDKDGLQNQINNNYNKNVVDKDGLNNQIKNQEVNFNEKINTQYNQIVIAKDESVNRTIALKSDLQEQINDQYNKIVVVKQESKIQDEKIDTQNEHIKALLRDNGRNSKIFNEIDSHILEHLDKNISFQSTSFQQRIDQFLFDAKIEMKNQQNNKAGKNDS